MILNFSLFFNNCKKNIDINSSNEPNCTALTIYMQKKKALHSGVPFSF